MTTDAVDEPKVKKSYNLTQSVIDAAREALGVGTETEAIDLALRLVAYGESMARATGDLLGEEYHDELGLADAPQ